MRIAENTGRKKVAKNRHLGTIAQLCRAISSQLRHISTIRKKVVKQQYVLHMSPQYGELRPTSGWDRLTCLGYPCKFQLVSRLGSVTARHLVVGVSQTLRRWTEGATYNRQGDHHVGHWPIFLVVLVLVAISISFIPNFSLVIMIIKPKCYNYNKMLFTTLHRILHKEKWNYDDDTIMLYIGI